MQKTTVTSSPFIALFKLGHPFHKILRSFFKLMFPNFFLNPFSFINNCFQMLNVKMASVSGVMYIKFVNKD